MHRHTSTPLTRITTTLTATLASAALALGAVALPAVTPVALAAEGDAPIGDVPINEQTFPDIWFRQYVLQVIDGGNKVLSPEERDKVTSIDLEIGIRNCFDSSEPYVIPGSAHCRSVYGEEAEADPNWYGTIDEPPYRTTVADLAGIEYFPNLVSLNATYGHISYMDLSQNTKLETLWMGGNFPMDLLPRTEEGEEPTEEHGMSLDLSKNTALKQVLAGGAVLKEINVSNNPALEELAVDRNLLREIDVSNSPKLKKLDIHSNGITELDVSANTQLTGLNVAANALTHLDLSKNTALTSFNSTEDMFGRDSEETQRIDDPQQHAWIGIVDQETQEVDFSRVPGAAGLDLTKTRNWQHAARNDDIIKVDNVRPTDPDTADTITYDYDTGAPKLPNATMRVKLALEYGNTVTVQDVNGGTGQARPVVALPGEEVSLTVTPRIGYRFDSWQVDQGGVTITDGKFTMPDGQVTLTPVFKALPKQEHKVSFNGTVNLPADIAGAEAQLTAEPKDGYTFTGWEVKSGELTLTDPAANPVTFTIPEGGVELVPVYEPTDEPQRPGGDTGPGTANNADELEPGEIAGIVIGVIALIAILGGAAYAALTSLGII